MKLVLSTGIFHKYYDDEDLNKRIRHISQFDIDGIEILYGQSYNLNEEITKENKEYLKTKIVTLHMPFWSEELGWDYKMGEYDLRKLVLKYKELNAKHIIIHPDLMEDLSLLDQYNINFVFENVKPKMSEEFCLQNMKNEINKYNCSGFCCDAGHAKDLDGDKQIKFANDLPLVENNIIVSGNWKEFYKDLRYNNETIFTIEERIHDFEKLRDVIIELKGYFKINNFSKTHR